MNTPTAETLSTGSGARALPASRPRDPAGAVTALFREHQLELVRLARIMVGDLATAEDVVQDAFEKLHRGWPRLRDDTLALAYARAAVLNGCRSFYRHGAVARRHAPALAPPEAQPDSAHASAEREAMVAALRTLPRRQREVLALRYYADLDVAEVSQTLGISASTVRSTTTRGLAALACVLKEN